MLNRLTLTQARFTGNRIDGCVVADPIEQGVQINRDIRAINLHLWGMPLIQGGGIVRYGWPQATRWQVTASLRKRHR